MEFKKLKILTLLFVQRGGQIYKYVIIVLSHRLKATQYILPKTKKGWLKGLVQEMDWAFLHVEIYIT
jgi:hypothetical protein